jgi:hypothetical protein
MSYMKRTYVNFAEALGLDPANMKEIKKRESELFERELTTQELVQIDPQAFDAEPVAVTEDEE